MEDLFEINKGARLTGIRIERMELQNWGTFDNDIFVLDFAGEPALLVGKNGTGKTTISDAILTLLVESGRNYNVSASAYGKRKGRNKSSYIRGAYKEVSQEGQIQSKPDFLRPKEGKLSVLLGVFKNHSNGKLLTIAQILYMSGGSEKTIYSYREADSTIANELSSFLNLQSVKRELKQRGFTVAEGPRAYFEKIRNWTGMRPQALDVFNQTVAIKEIENLNVFIRKYMLDSKDYGPQVQELTRHYRDLDSAYQRILHNEAQLEVLEPINEKGKEYDEVHKELKAVQKLIKVRIFFFLKTKEKVYSAAICDGRVSIGSREKAKEVKGKERDVIGEEIVNLKIEKKQKGGFLNTLEQQKKDQEKELADCTTQFTAYSSALRAMDINERPSDEDSFNEVSRKVRALVDKAAEAHKDARSDALNHRTQLNEHIKQRDSDEEELKHLQGNKSNIPQNLGELRDNICAALQIPVARLPFAAELIQIRDDEEKWRMAAELVLGGFGRTMLVPPELHASVVEYAEHNKLKDRGGKGMLLEYEKVDSQDQFGMGAQTRGGSDFLGNKLQFKLTHEFGSWVKREVKTRFPVKCIEDLDAFRSYHDRAVTLEGQIRFDNGKIRKDDRDKSRDSKNFILGWDNEKKREELTRSISTADKAIEHLEEAEKVIGKREEYWSKVKHHGPTVTEIATWTQLDMGSIETKIEKIANDIEDFKAKNQSLGQLDDRIKVAEAKDREISREIERMAKEIGQIETNIKTWQDAHDIAAREKLKTSTPSAESLAEYADSIKHTYMLTVESIEKDDTNSAVKLSGKQREIERKEDKLCGEIEKLMTSFLEQFKADGFWQRLCAEIGYLEQFRKEYTSINGEGLPKHKEKFRTMARDRVHQDLAQLSHELRHAEKEIKKRIDEINKALYKIEYNTGTYMLLRHNRSNYQERDKLLKYLSDALSQSLGGERTYEQAEQFFKSIEPLIKDLTSDDGWANRATDVRNWFEFASNEKRKGDDAEVRSLTSTDTASGGEKAKLAFTILVAALVYQYDIDTTNPKSERFRFAVIDEAFAKVDDIYADYVLNLFKRFGLQILIIAPLDPKSLIVVPYMDYYIMTVKSQSEDEKDRSQILTMTKKVLKEKLRSAPPIKGIEEAV